MPSRKKARSGATALRHRINAGRVALLEQREFFDRQFGHVASEWKADDTRVTFADFAIAEKTFAALRRHFPRDDYCSEEANPLDEEMPLEAPFAWVIDPIDGTNNYALGFPFCAISLALLRDGVPIYGFIYDYSLRRVLEGGPDFGLFENRRKLDRRRLAGEAQTILGLHFPIDATWLRRLQPMMGKHRVRCLGSGALLAAGVATGYLDGAFDQRVKVWDIAAAYALCEAAGVPFRFIGGAPFPLRRFHARMESCPYYAGGPEFIRDIQAAMENDGRNR